MSALVTQVTHLQIKTDPEPLAHRIGIIALATDHTTERDFAAICAPFDVGVYVNRIEYANPTTPENLRKTGPRLTLAAAEILPEETFDVMVFGCTAASVVLGDETVAGHIRKAKPGAAVVTPASAAFAAFETLKVRKVSVLTPYTPEVTEELARYFTANGLEVVSARCLGFTDDRQMARISRKSIIAAAEAAMSEEAEALFISCTALRAAACAEEIEQRIGKPVVTSNQATVWRSLRLAAIDAPVSGYGRLFGF